MVPVLMQLLLLALSCGNSLVSLLLLDVDLILKVRPQSAGSGLQKQHN